MNPNKIFKMPEQLKTAKSKLVFKIFTYIRIVETGKNSVIGRVWDSFKDLIMLYTALKVTNINPNTVQIVMFVGVLVILCYYLGWLYLKHDIDRINSLVNLQRDQFQRDVYKSMIKKNKREKL